MELKLPPSAQVSKLEARIAFRQTTGHSNLAETLANCGASQATARQSTGYDQSVDYQWQGGMHLPPLPLKLSKETWAHLHSLVGVPRTIQADDDSYHV